MSILSLLTPKGRARAKMTWSARWHSENKDFRKEKRGIKHVKHLRHDEQDVEKLIQEGMAFFDANETKQSVKERISEFIEEHELIRDMIYLADTEEYRLLERMEDMQEKLATFQANHHELTELNDTCNELHRVMENIRSVLNTERKRARDVLGDHQKMRDRSFLPFAMIYFKIRYKAKEGKKDAKHLKKLYHNVNHVLLHLQKDKTDTKELEKAIRKLHKDLKDGEEEMIEELEDLAQIQQYLTVLEFRDGIDEEEKIVEKLKEIQFPAHDQQELEAKLREAHEVVERLHGKEKTETRALYQTAKRAA